MPLQEITISQTHGRNNYKDTKTKCRLKEITISQTHGRNNYKDTKTKCRLNWGLIEFIDWRYYQSGWYFRPSFVNYCPSNLSLVHLPHPSPPSLSQITVYKDSVWLGGGEGGGSLSCVGDQILQEFNTLFMIDQIQNLQNCYLYSPQTKTQEGRGPLTNKHLPQSPLQVNFFRYPDIRHCFLSV